MTLCSHLPEKAAVPGILRGLSRNPLVFSANPAHVKRLPPEGQPLVFMITITADAAQHIPQIRRDFTARFASGKRYLDAADKRFDQPTYHARRILMLTELYDDKTLDAIIKIMEVQPKANWRE